MVARGGVEGGGDDGRPRSEREGRREKERRERERRKKDSRGLKFPPVTPIGLTRLVDTWRLTLKWRHVDTWARASPMQHASVNGTTSS
jgi:hypothetical protein